MNSTSKSPLKYIAGCFRLECDSAEFTSLGEGHIHDTYFVKSGKSGHPGYVLQRINSKVFPDVVSLMDNLQRITSHLYNKTTNAAERDHTLHLIKTPDGDSCVVDESGSYWRCFRFCRHAPLEAKKILPAHARSAGRALGRFQHLLSDLPGPPLHEVIPGFHDLKKRLERFYRAIEANALKRNIIAANEIDMLLNLEEEMLLVHRLGKTGKIPLRITHNDTKFNNFLFDDSGEAKCLIDLDTVMNGYVLYDFGDAVRTITNTSHEDHPSPEAVRFDHVLFGHFTRGYWESASAFLTETETTLLAFSPGMMTYTMAVRFLTDFLEGDVYYKIKYPEHNLHRTQNQLELLRHIRAEKTRMEDTVSGIVGA